MKRKEMEQKERKKERMNECYTIQYDTIPVVVVVEAKKRNGREREKGREE